jgi:hypothetical protein
VQHSENEFRRKHVPSFHCLTWTLKHLAW